MGKPERCEAATEELTTRCEGERKAPSDWGPGDAPGRQALVGFLASDPADAARRELAGA